MKTLRDTWLMFERSMGIALRNPVWVVVSLTQPLYFLVLFGPLLTSLTGPGLPADRAFNVFVPGLLIQLGIFGTLFVGLGLIAEVRNGVVERMRVTPVSRLALLLGRAFRDIVILLVQGVLLILAAIPFGLRIHFLGLVVAIGLLGLIGLVLVSTSYALSLWLRSEDALAPMLNTLSLPLLLLSGILLPLSLAPGWLQWISALNPLRYAVDATRDLFNGQLATASVARGVVVMTLLAVITLWISARSFARSAA
ncbi:MAG: ABC transporter permease [Candidatus Dormibacteria bacterium]